MLPHTTLCSQQPSGDTGDRAGVAAGLGSPSGLPMDAPARVQGPSSSIRAELPLQAQTWVRENAQHCSKKG